MNLFLKLKSNILTTLLFLFGKNRLHQISKFSQIYNIWSNIYLDDLSGDYIEFGIFKGKSLLHSTKAIKIFLMMSKFHFMVLTFVDFLWKIITFTKMIIL